MVETINVHNLPLIPLFSSSITIINTVQNPIQPLISIICPGATDQRRPGVKGKSTSSQITRSGLKLGIAEGLEVKRRALFQKEEAFSILLVTIRISQS